MLLALLSFRSKLNDISSNIIGVGNLSAFQNEILNFIEYGEQSK